MKTRTVHPADQQEHLCLQRHLAALQERVSHQLAALVEAEAQACARADAAERQCRAMERALINERTRAVLACTRWSWGLGGPPPQAVPGAVDADAGPPTTAAEVLCQTGCQGHAHPWLDADGSCRLTGGDCTRVRDAVPAGAPEDQSAYR